MLICFAVFLLNVLLVVNNQKTLDLFQCFSIQYFQEKFVFFSKAVLSVLPVIGFKPDIIHCHDWQTGLLPIYLRTVYYGNVLLMNVKTIFTIHNIEYQGRYHLGEEIMEDVFGVSINDGYLLEYKGGLNIMKGAMESSNKVSTVSPTYAEEICTPTYAHELEHEVIRVKDEGKLFGILNGIDTTFYNPSKDKAIYKKYSVKSLEDKKITAFPILSTLLRVWPFNSRVAPPFAILIN